MAAGRRKYPGRYVLIGTALVFLNFIGITFSLWSEDLVIDGSWATGKVELAFTEQHSFSAAAGSGSLQASFATDGKGGPQVMSVYGKAEPGYEAFLHYSIKNSGTLPVTLCGKQESNAEGAEEGIIVYVHQHEELLEAGEHLHDPNGLPMLQIHVPHGLADGIYSFEIRLPYRQWNI